MLFKVCRGKQNGEMIANPSNCRAYIECQQNLRLDRECEKGELFETRGGVCLSDFVVDCGSRAIPSDVDDATMRNVRFSILNILRMLFLFSFTSSDLDLLRRAKWCESNRPSRLSPILRVLGSTGIRDAEPLQHGRAFRFESSNL